MATFRRSTAKGATWFFTVVTYRRQPVLAQPHALQALRAAVRSVRQSHPFEIVAWVVLPDHMHAIWRLPDGDAAYPTRWALIKRDTAQASRHLISAPVTESARKRGEIGFWQRRYWEHQLRDEVDLSRHVDYIHYNPVKHGLTTRVVDWPHSTFHRYVQRGLLAHDWAVDEVAADDMRFGE